MSRSPSSIERWQRIEELFHELVELPAGRRPRFLEQVDEDLRPDLERLLAAEDEAGDFMEEGPSILPPLSMPERLGPYRLIEPLGEGGAGTVYLAERDDDAFRQKVAVKILRWERVDADLLRRFQYERQILAELDHPYIAKILDGGTTDGGLPYYVLELVDGVPLDEYCRDHELSVTERLDLFRKVCEAVQHAHQKLIVHRDLKPSNVLVTADGTPKLLDFGIAKLLDPERISVDFTTTARWYRPLTPRYASPEQIQGRPITTRSDVYSLGLVLYQLLTERMPYRVEGRGLQQVEKAVLHAEVQPPSVVVLTAPDDEDAEPKALSSSPKALSRRLAGDLDTIVLKALRKEPSRRYGSVEQLSEDLRRHLQGMPVHARPDTWRYRVGKLIARRPWETAASILFVVVSITLVTFLALQSRRLAEERDEAQRQEAKSRQVLSFLQNIFSGIDPVVTGKTQLTAMELLERGTARLSEFEDRPETQMALRLTLGQIYMENGRFDRAEPLLRAVVETRRSLGLPQDRDLSEALAMHGIALRLLKRFDEAEQAHLEALDLRRQIFGPQSQEALWSLNDLAVIYSRTGRYERAVETYGEILDGSRRLNGSNDPQVASILNNLGTALIRLERFPEAEAAYREALEIRREALGPKELYTLYTETNLAFVLVRQRKWVEAETHLAVSRPALLEMFGPEHGQTLTVQLLGVRIARQRGHYDEADRILDALEEHHPVGGGNVSDWTAVTLDRSRLLLDRGDAHAAEPFARAALEGLRRELPPSHPARVDAGDHLAEVLAWTGTSEEALTEALALQQEALDALRALYGSDHPRIASSLGRSALLRARLGAIRDPDSRPADRARWEEHLETLDRAERMLGKPSRTRADELSRLLSDRARVLELSGRHNEARGALEQAHSIFSRFFSAEHPRAKLFKQRASKLP